MASAEAPMEPTTTADRARGTLLGLGAGDRIGGPANLALRLAESLAERRGFDAADVARRYLEWWRNGAFDTGPTTARVLELAASGAPFLEAAERADREVEGRTAGCNPAHRCAPLAICAEVADSELAGAAIVEARLTHRHPLAGDAAAAVTVLCRALVRGRRWHEALECAAREREPEIRTALSPKTRAPISDDGFVPETLQAAVSFVATSECLVAALRRAIEFAGGANYCPVLVGAIGGARWGSGGFEARRLDHLGETAPRLRNVARRLARGWEPR